MADVQISLNNIRQTRSLYIEDLGMGFTVRKLGAGEELDLSDKMRRLDAIRKELRAIDFTKYDTTKKEDLKKIEEINNRAADLMEEVNNIQRFELDTYKRCFTDNNGGKDVDLLLDSLSIDARVNLFNQLFDKPKPVEAPESGPRPEVEQEPKKESKASQKTSKEPEDKK